MWHSKKLGRESNVNHLFEEDDEKLRPKLHLDIEEKEVRGGFQNINNMGRFLKAAQIMGTRRLR